MDKEAVLIFNEDSADDKEVAVVLKVKEDSAIKGCTRNPA